MSDDNWTNMTVRMRDDEAEAFGNIFESKSGSARRILSTWMEIAEDHDLDEDFEELELAVLRTYLNAVQKNIETMKSQRDKIQNRIDEIEEDGDGEVFIEVDLRMKQWQL